YATPYLKLEDSQTQATSLYMGQIVHLAGERGFTSSVLIKLLEDMSIWIKEYHEYHSYTKAHPEIKVGNAKGIYTDIALIQRVFKDTANFERFLVQCIEIMDMQAVKYKKSGYVKGKNYDTLVEASRGVLGMGVGIPSLSNYYEAALMSLNKKERFLKQYAPYLPADEYLLMRQLQNPRILTPDEFRAEFPESGPQQYTEYLTKLVAYTQNIISQTPTYFEGHLQENLAEYLNCFDGIGVEIDQEIIEFLNFEIKSLQIHLGINPFNPSQVKWSYQQYFYDATDYIVKKHIATFGLKKYAYYTVRLKDGATQKMKSVYSDRRLRIVMQNPDIPLDSYAWAKDLTVPQRDMLERLRVQTAVLQNGLAEDYNQIYHLKIKSTKSITLFYPTWNVVWNGGEYGFATDFKELEKKGFVLVTPEEILNVWMK
ncbi:MAG: hypothetical protein ACTSRK_08165, partial [Promethearchaeota archaeon]